MLITHKRSQVTTKTMGKQNKKMETHARSLTPFYTCSLPNLSSTAFAILAISRPRTPPDNLDTLPRSPHLRSSLCHAPSLRKHRIHIAPKVVSVFAPDDGSYFIRVRLTHPYPKQAVVFRQSRNLNGCMVLVSMSRKNPRGLDMHVRAYVPATQETFR